MVVVDAMDAEAPYLSLHKSGELKRRALRAFKLLEKCSLCPRACAVNRRAGEKGFCQGLEDPHVASLCDHHGEEPVISGERGSGTVFFGHCNMRCAFCQNWQISQPLASIRQITCEELGREIVLLEKNKRVHNINFVSPSHVVPQVLKTVDCATALGLTVPIVYNSNGYDGVDSLRLLDGVVSIYLPDLKYDDGEASALYSSTPSYFESAKKALLEMWRQAGPPILSPDGTLRRGLVIRHLVLPNRLAGTRSVFLWVKENIGTRVFVSLMSQYYPAHRACHIEALNRPLKKDEYEQAMDAVGAMGFDQVFIQPIEDGAARHYRPDFDFPHPFER